MCPGQSCSPVWQQRTEQALVSEQMQVAHVLFTNMSLSSVSHFVRFARVIEEPVYGCPERSPVVRIGQQDAGAAGDLVSDAADR